MKQNTEIFDNSKHENHFHKEIISWEAPEYIQHEKGWKWFFIAGFSVIALMISSLLVGNWTLALALIALSVVYVWQHFFTPKHVKIIISGTGIKVGDKEYPYQNIDSFWIIYKPPHVKTLNLRSKSRFLPDISIQLNDQDPSEVREYLCSQIPELEGKEESFTDIIIRLCKL
jgi:hypothetical protein